MLDLADFVGGEATDPQGVQRLLCQHGGVLRNGLYAWDGSLAVRPITPAALKTHGGYDMGACRTNPTAPAAGQRGARSIR
ncbi:hypothetical protein GCM10009099_38740 [Caenispirillum bisanense]